MATLKDGSIEFEALWKPGDAAFDALQSVVIEADCPSDIHTTGIRLCCL